MEGALWVEDPQAHDRMPVGVKIQETPVALGRNHHRGHGALERREVLLEELPRGGVGGAGDLAVKRALEEERFAEELGDGEDELDVGDARKDFLHHALGPQERALLRARGAETPRLTRKGDGDAMHPLWPS